MNKLIIRTLVAPLTFIFILIRIAWRCSEYPSHRIESRGKKKR